MYRRIGERNENCDMNGSGMHRRMANPVGRGRLNHRRKPQFAYYANAIQRSNEVGGLLVRILGVPHVRRRGIN